MCAVYSTNLFLLERWTGRHTLPSLVMLSSAKAVPCLALLILSARCCKPDHVPSPPLHTDILHAQHIQILNTIFYNYFWIKRLKIYHDLNTLPSGQVEITFQSIKYLDLNILEKQVQLLSLFCVRAVLLELMKTKSFILSNDCLLCSLFCELNSHKVFTYFFKQ